LLFTSYLVFFIVNLAAVASITASQRLPYFALKAASSNLGLTSTFSEPFFLSFLSSFSLG
jgi:hypothetical protein